MISTKTKETAILMAGFGFLSKELQEVMERKNITLDQIANTNDYTDLRQVVRLLQSLEMKIGTNEKAEKYLNKSIAKVNKNGEHGFTFINAIVGLSILMKYKEDFKFKKVGRGLSFNTLNNIYDFIERGNMGALDEIQQSMDISDLLYQEILK